ncbi:MAG TPA: hypothetical protein PKL49_06235 [Steroidobacteraceae bacterium]|jgi:hypothetical protein|nr:hypothetical protein [Steroidobacteraceae bacterium]HNS27889.1 hypothetical protein [Steroidobacteraceae bacterium]
MVSTERRAVPWLWFLVPIFSLLAFFALRSCKEAPSPPQTEIVEGL